MQSGITGVNHNSTCIRVKQLKLKTVVIAMRSGSNKWLWGVEVIIVIISPGSSRPNGQNQTFDLDIFWDIYPGQAGSEN